MESANISETKQQLVELIRERSYREGEFTLSSGQRSSFYIDLKATTLHPRGADLIGRLAVAMLQAPALRDELRIDAVGGLTLGADPIATAVSLAAWREQIEWPAFIVRKEAKGHGTGRYIEGIENLRPQARVLVVEDVCTTGASSLFAVDRLIDAGYLPVAVLTVVDREQGAEKIFAERGLKLLSLAKLRELTVL